MELILFTVVALAVYWLSDVILKRIEHEAGRRLENRQLVFFAIMLLLASSSFYLLRLIAPG